MMNLSDPEGHSSYFNPVNYNYPVALKLYLFAKMLLKRNRRSYTGLLMFVTELTNCSRFTQWKHQISGNDER